MAKTTAPLLGFGASGQIGKAQVYSKWKGVTYARKHVIPANPQTAKQMETRNIFKWLSGVFKQMTPDMVATWQASAKGNPVTDRNIFNKANIPPLLAGTTNDVMVFSHGAGGGPPILGVTPTGGAGQISFAVTTPTPPTGWTITDIVAAAVRSQDPRTGVLYQGYSEKAASSPVVITGLAAGTYIAGVWLVWTKPDLSLAYSPSVTTSAVVS